MPETNPIAVPPEPTPVNQNASNPSVVQQQQAATYAGNFGSMGALKSRAPTLWKALMRGIGSQIIYKMNKDAKRLAEIWREDRENSKKKT